MANPQNFNFNTGPSPVPDVGVCSYNGCVFSPLFQSSVSGKAVLDEAQRTIKYMEYIITVDGYVTLAAGFGSTSQTMQDMRRLLSKQAGALNYTGRGNDIIVNVGDIRDVKWGPIPEILEFQPLGGGHSAKVKWTCKVAILEQGYDLNSGGPGGGLKPPPGGNIPPPGGRVVPGPSKAFVTTPGL